MTNHPIHKAWMRMNARCNNPNYEHYDRYGGRGIRVCERWKSFESFYADVHSSWQSGLTLDRYPDVNGDYGPSNFRWATIKEQCNNRSTNHFIEANGSKKTLAEWSRETGFDHRVILARLKMGWTAERALTEKVLHAKIPNIEELKGLLASGVSARKAAKKLNVSRHSVKKAMKIFEDGNNQSTI